MGVNAYIDGKVVPCVMTLCQVQALFPQGLLGLRECFGERSPVVPRTDGSVYLRAGAFYSLGTGDASDWPSQTVTKGTVREVCAWDPSASTLSAPDDVVTDASMALSTANVAYETLLIPSPNAPSSHARENAQDACLTSFPQEPQLGKGGSGMTYNVGRASSVGDDEYGRRNVDYSGNLPPVLSQVRIADVPGKHIQDRVHEYVFLPPIAIRVVDTPEFQRLRSLKQLGTTVFLYPGATHTRFEHSIGVAHLASEMVRHIAICQPELNITLADIICVTVAGLCHDIGHGPFSHLFEQIVNRIRGKEGNNSQWHHEQMSVRLLRRILSQIDLEEYGLTDEDARFIEVCILGLSPKSPWPTGTGRPPCKRYLVDIVANKRNGLDVDRLDYFLRDSLACYGRAALDVHIPRLLSACKVFCFEGEYQLCFEEKMALSLGDIFNVRAKLHKHAYQHRVVKVTDYMVSDVLLEADPYFTVRGTNGKPIRMSECVEDEVGFCQLGDWVCNAIAASTDPRLAKAQLIIQRINQRNLYRVVDMAMFSRFQVSATEESIRDEILIWCNKLEDDTLLQEAIKRTLIVSFIVITYGSLDAQGNPDDPINHVTFYNPKATELGAFKLPGTRVSPLFSPSHYGERMVIVMVRDEEFLDIVRAAFEAWKLEYGPRLGDAVPTTNRRKDETPGKASAKARSVSQNSNVLSGNDIVPFEGMQRQAQTASLTQESPQKQKSVQRNLKRARTSSCAPGDSQRDHADEGNEISEKLKRICS
ncbi:SAM domain-containing protein [Trypanosoma rangeli]|uniref:SAM domain-containing protein n=1 Tax=Trypanosoma rangeli TaxID=5698 RepID=A0A3R7LQB8_TRYRA|nr:SAM domain-containing protein [Trypanosoma rangeli]RNF01352.1 SAM domain-containing protein [Trypanosoma rangeli]|eukprot:RNF01352.1 SAM domain-containing protein [Trypanosoma rangeli]